MGAKANSAMRAHVRYLEKRERDMLAALGKAEETITLLQRGLEACRKYEYDLQEENERLRRELTIALGRVAR